MSHLINRGFYAFFNSAHLLTSKQMYLREKLDLGSW